MITFTQEQLRHAVAQALESCQHTITPYVKDFCQRMYASPFEQYVERLRMIGFTGKKRVLDAGCGFGQWSFALLAANNDRVEACDVARERIEILQSTLRQLDEHRIVPVLCDLENLPYETDSFDAIFCYGAIHCANVPTALVELHRVLQPGGTLYATANGLGFYVQRWIEAHPRVNGHIPRIQMAQALLNTALVSSGATKKYPVGIVIEQDEMRDLLARTGFVNTTFAPDGHTDISGRGNKLSFFPGDYRGMTAVYECKAQKQVFATKNGATIQDGLQ